MTRPTRDAPRHILRCFVLLGVVVALIGAAPTAASGCWPEVGLVWPELPPVSPSTWRRTRRSPTRGCVGGGGVAVRAGRDQTAYSPSVSNDLPSTSPFGVLFVSMVMLGIASQLFVNLNEDPGIFIIFTLVFAAPGAFLLIAGAVAFGIQVARRG